MFVTGIGVFFASAYLLKSPEIHSLINPSSAVCADF
jgi:hypothetical protein